MSRLLWAGWPDPGSFLSYWSCTPGRNAQGIGNKCAAHFEGLML